MNLDQQAQFNLLVFNYRSLGQYKYKEIMNIQNHPQFRKEEKKFDLTPRISIVSKSQRFSNQNKNGLLNSGREIHSYKPIQPPRRRSIQTDSPYFPRYIEPIIRCIPSEIHNYQPQFAINSKKEIDNYYLYSFKKQQSTMGQAPQNLLKNQNKVYETQIQKLNRICEEFFKQNEKLKQKLHTQQQLWRRKIDNILIQKKSEHQIQNYNKLQYKTSQSQYNFQRLTDQLRKKQSQLDKYMKKQQQYIKVYVQKEYLENQIRNLQKIIQSLNKKVEQYSRQYKNENLNPLSGKVSKDGIKQIEKNVQEQNKKLLHLLTMSSKEVDRLNQILTTRMLQDQKNKAIIYELNMELIKFKQKQEEQVNSIPGDYHKVKDQGTQYDIHIKSIGDELTIKKETEIHQIKLQNDSLKAQLSNQRNYQQTLKSQIQQLQKQLNMYMVEEDDRETIKGSKNLHISKQYEEFYIDNCKSHIELKGVQSEKLDALEERIKYLKEQNKQLSEFIMQQNGDIIQLKNHILILTQKQQKMQQQLHRFANNQNLLPKLMVRVQDAQTKLLAVTKQCQKMLSEVQDSCNQSEIMHQKIQQTLDSKNAQFTNKDFIMRPMSSRSQIGKSYEKTRKKNVQNSMSNLEDFLKTQNQLLEKEKEQKRTQDLLQSASQIH